MFKKNKISLKETINKLLTKEYTNSLDIKTLTSKNILLEEKANKLKSFGFVNSFEISENKKQLDSLQKEIEINKKKIEFLYAVDYFKFKYPIYNLISRNNLSLLSGYSYKKVNEYYSTIPDEDLEVLESFNIEECDEAFIWKKRSWSMGCKCYIDGNFCGFKEKTEFDFFRLEEKKQIIEYRLMQLDYPDYIDKLPLYILAPNYCFEEKSLPCDDILLLKPVYYDNNFYFLIISNI